MWKAWEGGRIKALSSKISCPILDDDIVEKEAERLSKYFIKNFHTHNGYAYKYFMCELLNLINIGGQILFMDRFIGEGFQLYGIYVVFMNREDMEKRVGELFPIRTICMFEKHSLTGRKEELEGICLLTHNLLNEKIYGFLWFWMFFIAAMSILTIVYRIATLLIPSYRLYVFGLLSHIKNADEIRAVYKKIQIGDWFLLLLLQKNVNPQVYRALISRLAESPRPDVSNL
ncbi:Vinx5 [Hyposoter didymator ichnovirus]|nr:Vinx5 [Hyposoter didymator ichnovirus]